MKNLFLFVFVTLFALGFGEDAHAYIGPGAGLSMLGAFWGLVIAVFAALSFLILWPLRRMFKRKPAGGPEVEEANASISTETEKTPDQPAKT